MATLYQSGIVKVKYQGGGVKWYPFKRRYLHNLANNFMDKFPIQYGKVYEYNFRTKQVGRQVAAFGFREKDESRYIIHV